MTTSNEVIDKTMSLIDEYAEKRHTSGAPEYNADTAKAREAVLLALKNPSNAFCPSDMQALAITTAYEQGVGKGHQAVELGKQIENSYNHAWKLSYKEGKVQVQRAKKNHPSGKTFMIELDDLTKLQMSLVLLESGTDQQKKEALDFLRTKLSP